MRERFLKNWLLVLAGSSFAVFVAATACYQAGLFERSESPMPPAPLSTQEELPSAQELSGLLAARVRELDAAETQNVSWDTADRSSSAVYAVRPAIRLRGIVVSKRRRCALVAVEGERNAKIVFEGQSVAGIIFREISPAGCLCRWHGEDFFVPVE